MKKKPEDKKSLGSKIEGGKKTPTLKKRSGIHSCHEKELWISQLFRTGLCP